MLFYPLVGFILIIHVLSDCTHNNYIGTVNVTLMGEDCWRWDSLPPIFHQYTDSEFPDASVSDAANYCRNPDNDPDGPWCHQMIDEYYEYNGNYEYYEYYGNPVYYDYCETTACDQTTLSPPTAAAMHISSTREGNFVIIAENSAFSSQAVKMVSIKRRFQCFLECLKVEVCTAVTLSENECYIYDELLINDIFPETGKSIWKHA